MSNFKESPYIVNEDRLAKVLAAIQTLGTYRFYKRSFEEWADRISGQTGDADNWEKIFKEHPEFFRISKDGKDASLVWRRNLPKNYHVDDRVTISQEEFLAKSDKEKERVSRQILSNSDIQALIETAISIYARALQQKQDKRWWIPLVMTGIGLVLGMLPYLIDKVLK